MNKILKWTLAISGVGLLIYIVFWIYAMASFSDVFDTFYTTQDLIDNYNKKTTEIIELKNYVNKIVPPNKQVDIEFEDNNTLGIFHVTVDDNQESYWDIKVNSGKADSLLQKLGWTTNTLKTLKYKLDKANCISVKSGEPCNIGFQRSGMGKYFYNIFDKPIADSLQADYNDSCTYILYNDKVVLEYGGGAFGSQCFPNYKRGEQ